MIARAHTRRPAIIAFSGGFHGRTMMSLALTGKVEPYKTGFGPFPGEVFHAPFPNDYHGVSVADALAAPAEQPCELLVVGEQGKNLLDRRGDARGQADFMLGHWVLRVGMRDNTRGSRSGNRCRVSGRGKSGLHRARCQVMPGRREPTESATENRPPMVRKDTGKGETVR